MGNKTRKTEKKSKPEKKTSPKFVDEAWIATRRACTENKLTDEQVNERVRQHHARVREEFEDGFLPAAYANFYTKVKSGPGSNLTLRTYPGRPATSAAFRPTRISRKLVPG
jgi:hypothetical protein